jgi:hypothetical protein
MVCNLFQGSAYFFVGSAPAPTRRKSSAMRTTPPSRRNAAARGVEFFASAAICADRCEIFPIPGTRIPGPIPECSENAQGTSLAWTDRSRNNADALLFRRVARSRLVGNPNHEKHDND